MIKAKLKIKKRFLNKKEQKLVKMATNFNLKLTKILEKAMLGESNYKNDISNYMVNSVADLIKYTKLVMCAEFKKAANLDMDTSVRDEIPEDIFDLVWSCTEEPEEKSNVKQKITFAKWKERIIKLLVDEHYAVNANKAKHYLWEAESTVTNLNLKRCYKNGYTPKKYLITGFDLGFWYNDY